MSSSPKSLKSNPLLLLFLALFTSMMIIPPTLAAPYHTFPRVRVPQSHYEVLKMRQKTLLNPNAVTDIHCIDRTAHIVFHDQNVAELSICGGMAGSSNTPCAGSPATTEGKSGSALFTLTALEGGAGIVLTKEAWEACVRAARAACPTGSLSAVCVGGASRGGDVGFSLTAV
ncbi:hypothetical protein QBC47DRAFT_203032 [Echria macrotheca]|uniref:Uncharacterized protein n=1 Tax=Echria macrotheca TaxID=438768 RepID=A0AAJ0FB29_9PEZI|nr:hypothetical protein QBC47DRAFT_203032 [Echria macrotheca]